MKRKTKSSKEVPNETAKAVSVHPIESRKPTWSPEQVDLIKSTVAKGATDDELKLFLYTAARTGLDPLTKQIHFVKRGGQMTIQTGIDGYRAIAERTKSLAGITDPLYEVGPNNKPTKATVKVYRSINGMMAEFTASARWEEYVAYGPLWVKMPYLMLGKCAEALALRKAFPNDLSGLYTSEEMAQADSNKPAYKAPEIEGVIDAEDLTPPKKKVLTEEERLKVSIQKSLNELAIEKDGAIIKEYVRQATGLDLIPENYQEIDSRLALIVGQKDEDK